MHLASGALARASAHEVNNSLTAVRGYLDLARSQLDTGHKAFDAITKAGHAAEEAVSAVRDFLKATRPEGGIDPDGTLSGLIEDALKLLENLRDHPAPEPIRGEIVRRGATCPPDLVLVAENDTFVRSILISGLRAAGYEVHLAGDPDEIIAICSHNRDRSIVLVVDLEWEDLDGVEGAREVHERCPDASMILLSADTPHGDLPLDFEEIRLVHKPFTMASLLDLVQERGEAREKRPEEDKEQKNAPHDPLDGHS